MKQVRIMELRGTYKGGGGPDKTILLSAERHDESRFFVLVTYLRQPDDKEFQIGKMAADKGIHYVEVIDRRLIDVKCILDLSRLISKYNIDILHAHDDKSSLYGLFLKIMNPEIKIMYTCHLYKIYNASDTGGFIGYMNHVIRRKTALYIMKLYASPLLAVSAATKNLLVKDGIKEFKVKVLLNSIDHNFWKRERLSSTFRKELNISEDAFLIGLIGRLGYDKGIPTFLKVAGKVLSHHPGAVFVLVGEGRLNEVDLFKKESENLGIDKSVIFAGFRSDLINIYSSLDLFLMTSLAEGLPNTVIEAMSMEVPVVSTAVDGVPELVVDGETGFLCDIGDVDTLAKKVVELIENETLRNSFSKAARKRIEEKFSFERRLQLIEGYYLNLSANNKNGMRD